MLNKIVIMGRLTRDPELRRTGTGTAVTNFSVAVERDFAAGDGEKKTDFINCVAWRQTADFVKQWFTKGKRILLVGPLQNREYTAQDGTKRRVTEIVADEVEFADSKSEQAAPAAPQPAAKPQGFTEATDEPDDLPF